MTCRKMTFVNDDLSQKNPRVRKIGVRNSGAGNGRVNFMDAWKNAFFLQEKPMPIKFPVLGGGGYFGFWGGGADIIFMGARIFLINNYGVPCQCPREESNGNSKALEGHLTIRRAQPSARLSEEICLSGSL